MAIKFEDWMAQVDRLLDARYGVGSSDLPDYLWLDHFDNGSSPREAVESFMEDEDEML